MATKGEQELSLIDLACAIISGGQELIVEGRELLKQDMAITGYISFQPNLCRRYPFYIFIQYSVKSGFHMMASVRQR